MKSIKVFAPATIANVNVGFDSLGLALSNVGDTIELTVNNTQENKITEIVNGGSIPLDVDQNCCSVVIRKMQEALNVFNGVDIRLVKGFASGSGLGSSSASSAAAAYAYNQLIGTPYETKELVAFAAEGERVACGAAHVDNVAPALLGGIILARGMNKEDIIQLPAIKNIYALTFFPDIKINTSNSRKILREKVAIGTVSKQIALMGSFVASLYEEDLHLFKSSLKDLIVEPTRSLLIPKYDELKKAAFENKALAFGISGSGPSVFAFTFKEANAIKIQQALEEVYKDTGIATKSYINEINDNSGARIID
ncbi:MAG: homoserine kinase [Vicingus serpentipes]|nr:homoserine kinase [Vicingus serpentipes]